MVALMQVPRCFAGSLLGRGACDKWPKEHLKRGLLTLLRGAMRPWMSKGRILKIHKDFAQRSH